MGKLKKPEISGKDRAPGKQMDPGTGCLCLCVNLAGKIHQAKGHDQQEVGGQFSKYANRAEQEERDLRIIILSRG